MKDIQFEKAFSSVPDHVHLRVTQTLKEVRTMKLKKTKSFTALVLAAVMTVLLAGVALAAAINGGVLDYLFFMGKDQPTKAQEELVKHVGAAHENEGVKTTVEDVVFDGRHMALSLGIETEKPLYVILQSLTVNGEYATLDFANFHDSWLGSNPAPYGFQATLNDDLLSGEMECKVRLLYLVPTGEEKSVPLAPDEAKAYADWQAQVDELITNGYVVNERDQYDGCWLKTHSDRLKDETLDIETLATELAVAYERYGNMKIIDDLEIAFTLNASDFSSNRLDITPKGSLNDGRYRIEFDEVLLTPLASDFKLRLYANEPFTKVEDLNDLMTWFDFFDENKQPLAFQNMQYMGDSGLEEELDGTLAYVVRYPMPPLAAMPKVIYMVPRSFADNEPNWDYAIQIPVK